MIKLHTHVLAGLAALLLSTTGHATQVLPGSVAFLAGDTSVTAPNTTGVVKNDNLIPFQFQLSQFQSVGGNVQNRVVESTNLGTMVFDPRIRDTFNIATLGFEIFGFTLNGYAGWDTDIGFRIDGLGDVGPTSVSRSVDGNLLTFRYDDPLSISGLAGGLQEESLFPFIVTDAPTYALTGSMILYGRSTANPDQLMAVTITGLAVPSAVPLPAPLVLLGSGLALLLGIGKRKLRTA